MKTVEIYLKGGEWIVLTKENGVVQRLDEFQMYETYDVRDFINSALGVKGEYEL